MEKTTNIHHSTTILDDPRPIAKAIQDKKYQIANIISRGLANKDKIRASAKLRDVFLEDARLFHPNYVAWRHGLLPEQARSLIRELENPTAL